MNISQAYLFKNLLIFLLFIVISCGKKPRESNVVESNRMSESTYKEDFYINDIDQVQIAAISIGDIIEIYASNDYIYRECGVDLKCKYKNADGQTIYEVRYKDEGFKIQDRDANLLLKVKLSDKKIKIGRDEEMVDPIVIKISSPDKVKLAKGDTEIGQARMGQGALPVQVTNDKETYYLAGPRKEPAEVVMVLPDTDFRLRLILLAELLHSGK